MAQSGGPSLQSCLIWVKGPGLTLRDVAHAGGNNRPGNVFPQLDPFFPKKSSLLRRSAALRRASSFGDLETRYHSFEEDGPAGYLSVRFLAPVVPPRVA